MPDKFWQSEACRNLGRAAAAIVICEHASGDTEIKGMVSGFEGMVSKCIWKALEPLG